MGWGTEMHPGMTSASPPPDGLPHGTGSGHLLVEDGSITPDDLPVGARWQCWSSRNVALPDGDNSGGRPCAAGMTADGKASVYDEFVARCSCIAPDYAGTTALDRKFTSDLCASHRFHIIDGIPYRIEIPPISQGTHISWQQESRS
jgi:hypothetical protein